MNRQQAATEFQELMTSPTERGKMARFREVFDLVDAALRAGVTRPAVIARLAKLGLELSPATFKSYVERMRRDQAANAPALNEMPAAPRTAPAAPSNPSPSAAATDTQAAQTASALPTPTEGPRPFDPRAIRAQNYNLEALRARWRDRQREEAAAAKASTSDPAPPTVPTPGPAGPP